MIEPFFDRLAKIDAVIARGPSGVDFQRDVQPHMIEEAAESHFFNSLSDPGWLDLLGDAGKFSSPSWSLSRYLARMAAIVPEKVLRIILQIPETESSRVRDSFIDAALTMPPELAAKLVPQITVWLLEPKPLVLPDKLGSLISHLGRGGQVSEALEIAKRLLALIPGDKVEAELPGGTYRSRRDSEARFDSWYYEQILKNNIPDLVAVAGEKALLLLCDLLDSAVTSKRLNHESNSTEDYSYVWRAAIEDHPQNQSFGIATLLVSAARDAGENIAKGDPSKVPELVRILEGYKWNVFYRIGLHLLRLFPDAASSHIPARLTDKNLFNASAFRHEYVLLLQSQFAKLGSEDQKTILGWIEDGPKLETFKTNEKELTGTEASEEDRAKYKRAWQLKRLAPLREVLSPDWKKRYDDLVQEFGEPEHPDLVTYFTTWEGPTSPKTAADVRSMSVKELVDFLKSWSPSPEPRSPTPEGLGREITSLVASEPQKFAEECHQFQDTHPTYVRSILSGLRDAVGQKRMFPWPPVLELCQWIVEQPRETGEEPSAHLERDPHWGWTRKTIADLLEQGFGDGVTAIRFNERQSAWNVLRPITDDPEPTPEYEAQYGGSNMDPAHVSINTTRGEAMHAVVRYALWVRRHIEKDPDGTNRIASGFDEMPEVREVLDTHLDSARDPSLAIRSVYGRWFPWLLLLDPNWTQSQVLTIFPSDESLRPFFHAAWDTYIIFCQAYDNVLEVLKPVYSRAIERLGSKADSKSQSYDPEHHLATHLMSYYWRGKLKLTERKGLLSRFWERADDKVRAHAMEFIGRSLGNTKGKIPARILRRIQALWESRLNLAKSAATPDNFKSELAAFGWWFKAGKFDDRWAIKQLREALLLAHRIDPDRMVVERLAKIAAAMPGDSVECLRLLAEADGEPWRIYAWRDEARKVLSAVIAGRDSQAREAAIQLVHRLGAMGHLEFRDVLTEVS